jgi:hypothetical protein
MDYVEFKLLYDALVQGHLALPKGMNVGWAKR